MGLKFILGPSGSGKTKYILDEIIEKSLLSPKEKFILIVPDQFTLQMQKELIKLHPNHGFFNIDIVSFTRLGYRVFEELSYIPKPVLDDTGKLLILRKVLEEKKDELVYFKKNVGKFGFVSNVKSLISELLQYNNSVALLSDSLNKVGGTYLSTRLKDIVLIYDSFMKALGDEYLTTENILNILSSKIHLSTIVRNSHFYLDGFTGFTPIQLDIIDSLITDSLGVNVSFTLGVEDKDKALVKPNYYDLFALTRQNIVSIYDRCIKNNQKVEPVVFLGEDYLPRLKSDEIRYLEKNIFRYGNDEYTSNLGINDIKIFNAFNPISEVEHAVYEIIHLIENEGYMFRDIAVICDNEEYLSIIKNVFERNKIKAFIDVTENIFNDPFVAFIRGILRILSEKFSRESVIEFLKCGLITEDDEDIFEFENYIMAFGIKGIKGFSKEFTLMRYDNEDLCMLDSIRTKYIVPILEVRNILKNSGFSAQKGIRALYDLIERFDCYNILDSMCKQASLEGLVELEMEYRVIYEKIMDLFDQIHSILGDSNVTLDEFMGILDTGIEQIKIKNIPAVLDSVIVGDTVRSRLNNIKAIFLLGANDGIIPKISDKRSIFSKYDKEILSKYNIMFSPSMEDELFIQKFYLYLLFTKASEKIYLSYSSVDISGVSTTPSYIIEQFLDMFKGLKINTIADYPDFLEYIDNKKEKEYDNQNIKELDDDICTMLVDSKLKLNVSNIEEYSRCPYYFFMKRIAKLKTRLNYEFKSVDYGTICHSILEYITQKLIAGDKSIEDVDVFEVNKLILEGLEEVDNYKNGILNSSNINLFIKDDIKETMEDSITYIAKQIKAGQYDVRYAEKEFYASKDFKELNIKLDKEAIVSLNGTIDRLDYASKDDYLAIRVVDYKTYNKKFELAKLPYGLNLQLPIYIKAASLIAAKDCSDKEVVIGAMCYSQLDTAFVNADKLKYEESDFDYAIEKAISNKFKSTGIFNNNYEVLKLLDRDFESSFKSENFSIAIKGTENEEVIPDYHSNGKLFNQEELELICEYAFDLIKKTGNKILEGKIIDYPILEGLKSQCDYCDYKDSCHRSNNLFNVYRSKKKEEVMEEIKDICSRDEVE